MAKKSGLYADAQEDARAARRPSAKATASARAFRWCNVSLSVEMKEELKSVPFDSERVFEWLALFVESGYKVSISRDEKSDCFLVVASGRNEGAPDFNVGVSSRHPSLEMALLTTRYKFEVLFMGGYIPTESMDARRDVWD